MITLMLLFFFLRKISMSVMSNWHFLLFSSDKFWYHSCASFRSSLFFIIVICHFYIQKKLNILSVFLFLIFFIRSFFIRFFFIRSFFIRIFFIRISFIRICSIRIRRNFYIISNILRNLFFINNIFTFI